MRVLVTGGAGYLGEIVVRRLLARGDAVRTLDIARNDDTPPEVEAIRADVRDEAAVRRAVEGMEVVHHQVAQVPLAKDRAQFLSVNVGGTRNVLQACLDAGVRKVVLVSSSAVYGVPRTNPVTPSTTPQPQEAYGRAKLQADRLAEAFVARGLDVSLVRPRTVLGHGRLGIFAVLFEWVRRGRPVYLLGSGQNRYQFVHADDLVDVCVRASEAAGPATWLAGTDRFGTMGELLHGLVAHAGTGSPVRHLPFRAAQLGMRVTSTLGLSPLGEYHALMYARSMWFDLSATRAGLGWAPRWSNAEMIAESYDHYVAHREAILARSDASHHRSRVALGALRVFDFLP